ncbi:hypothetical protein CLU79DRAFT_767584 [Phycomyces nitens]|nr:hypothetical protein CLU79DRAFT_767584 [Phycomyces nitens]
MSAFHRLPNTVSPIYSHSTRAKKMNPYTKPWSLIFKKPDWKDIDIRSSTELEDICNIFQQSTYRHNRPTTVTLKLSSQLQLRSNQLRRLQQTFQNIKSLYMREIYVLGYNFERTANWRLWKNLTELHLCLVYSTNTRVEKKYIKILACLPHLTKLSLDETAYEKALRLSLNDLEDIHHYLPKLSYLSANTHLSFLSKKDLGRIPKVSPACKLTTFKLDVGDMDPLWIHYFAYKYSNLEHLEWDSNFEQRPMNEKQLKAALCAPAPPNGFRHLKTAKIANLHSSFQPNVLFSKMFGQLGIPFKKLSYSFELLSQDKEVSENIIYSCTNSCATTLQKLHLHSGYTPSPIDNISYSFVYLPHLVDLSIDIQDALISIDILLDRCPVLTRLNVQNGYITVARNKYLTMHGLRIVDIKDSNITSLALEYLSYRCRWFNYMRLLGTTIEGYLYEDVKEFRVEMIYTQFEALHIHNLNFSPLNDIKGFYRASNIKLILSTVNTPGTKIDERSHAYLPKRTRLQNKLTPTWLYMYKVNPVLSASSVQYKAERKNQVKISHRLSCTYYNKFRPTRRHPNTFRRSRSDKAPQCVLRRKASSPVSVLHCRNISDYKTGFEETTSDIFWETLYQKLR